jgi:hypothetical protein
LYPNCHKAFDGTTDPKLIIVPALLNFFENHEQVQQAMFGAQRVARVPPTLDEYHQYCDSYMAELKNARVARKIVRKWIRSAFTQ